LGESQAAVYFNVPSLLCAFLCLPPTFFFVAVLNNFSEAKLIKHRNETGKKVVDMNFQQLRGHEHLNIFSARSIAGIMQAHSVLLKLV